MVEMTVPLVSRGNGLWGSSSPAWDHLINRESSGRPTVVQSPSVVDVNTGGNEAEGLFQITPKTWQRHNGTDFASSARRATPQQQAIVAARIFTRNPTGSDWGAGRPGRESARDLAAGLVPIDSNQPAQENNVGWTGDPVWLEDVLRARPLLNGKVRTLDGWKDRGHGDFADVWGVLWHHTGNGRATAESIRDGRPDLAGPVSNIHIAQDGTVTVVAVGVAWHAGAGSGFGLPANNANNRLIGIECAWPMDTSITEATQGRERWPDAQIISMREVAAALTLKLGYDAGHNIGHKEWAGAAQGKWDPGNLDMNWFRSEVAKSMAGQFDGKPPVVTPPVVTPAKVWPKDFSDRELLEWVVAQLGNGDPSWASKGMSLRDKVWSIQKDSA